MKIEMLISVTMRNNLVKEPQLIPAHSDSLSIAGRPAHECSCTLQESGPSTHTEF